jgi:aspartate aminotransferase-like enzyme
MLPPGLAFLALSERAWARTRQAKLPRYYFDLDRERESQVKNTTAYTPAIPLAIGLRESLAMILEEGLPQVFARHDRMARATRAAALALGVELAAPVFPSPAATAIYVPAGIDGAEFVAYLRDKMGVTFGGGQGQWKGKVVRIAHVGYMATFDVIAAVAAFEMALKHFGHPVELGRGVAAAQQVLMEELPPHK